MADKLNAAPVLSVHATVDSKLNTFAQKDGQLIFVTDTQTIALDLDGKRKIYNQIEELATEAARTSLLAPVSGRYYFVMDPPVLWRYQEDGWIQITTPPERLDAVLQESKDYTDAVSKRVTGTIDENGNYIILFDENFFSLE